MLSPEQVASYQERGYIHIPQVFTPAEVDVLVHLDDTCHENGEETLEALERQGSLDTILGISASNR